MVQSSHHLLNLPQSASLLEPATTYEIHQYENKQKTVQSLLKQQFLFVLNVLNVDEFHKL